MQSTSTKGSFTATTRPRRPAARGSTNAARAASRPAPRSRIRRRTLRRTRRRTRNGILRRLAGCIRPGGGPTLRDSERPGSRVTDPRP